VKGLTQAGYPVRVLTLPNDPNVAKLDGTGCDIVYGDVSNSSSLQGAFDGVHTVYHLAAIIIAYDSNVFETVNVQGTKNMVAGASAAGVNHFVYVSSAAVTFPNASAYARSKAKGERVLVSQKTMHYTIVRPTLVYDKDGGQEFMLFVNYLKKYPVIPFIGRGRQKKNPVFAEDIVQGLLAIAGNPRAYGKTYNFSGGEVITIWDLARLILKHHGREKLFIPIPLFLCKVLAHMMEKALKHPPLTRYAITRMEQNADLDNTSARRDLDYNPVGITEGLQKCYPLADRKPS
jgi:NADH dehydrogenase